MRFGTQPGHRSRLDRRGRVYQRVARAMDHVPWLAAMPAYDLTVADRPPFVWYRVAKVGSRTVYRHLLENVDLRLDDAWQVRIPRRIHDDHFHFAFVRDPWDRLVSCWQQKVLKWDHFRLGADRERLGSFSAFVDFVAQFDLTACDSHLRLQATLIDLDRIDFLGRFERFEEDFVTVCRRLGIPESFGHRNPTDHDHYSLYYDERTAEVVGRLYELDIRLFGYAFEMRSQLRPASAPADGERVPGGRRYRAGAHSEGS